MLVSSNSTCWTKPVLKNANSFKAMLLCFEKACSFKAKVPYTASSFKACWSVLKKVCSFKARLPCFCTASSFKARLPCFEAYPDVCADSCCRYLEEDWGEGSTLRRMFGRKTKVMSH